MSLALRILLLLACAMAATVAAVAGLRFPPLSCGFLAFLAWKMTRQRWQNWSHGTASLSGTVELLRYRMLSNRDGLILGTTGYAAPPSRLRAVTALVNPFVGSSAACRFFGAAFLGMRSSVIRIRNYVHLATFAPTGKGKGVSILIPNLLSYRRSCVVTDPQGSLYTNTADHRRRKFRHRVVRLDPFGVCGPGGDSTNPLDGIEDWQPDFPDQCHDLAAAFVIRTGNEQESHFNDCAELMLTCFIAFVCACTKNRARRNLQTVRELLSSRDAYTDAIAEMKKVETHGGVISRMGHLCESWVDRELGSILSTVQRFTAFLDSEAMQRFTIESSFDIRDLRGGRMSIYLILPPERLTTHAATMRMCLTTILRTLSRMGVDERNPVLFLLDECGHLGHIQALEDAVTLMRGYGVRLWMFFQSVKQLNNCFRNSPTMLDNIGVQQFFGTMGYEAAEEISKRGGDYTTIIESINRTITHTRPWGGNGHQGGSDTDSTSVTYSPHGRALFRADEVLRVPTDLALTFVDNLPVIPVRLLRYYDHPLFKHGGTGVSRGLGVIGAVAASLLAVLFSLVCVILVGVILSLPVPAPSPGFNAWQAEAAEARRRARIQAIRRQQQQFYYEPVWYDDPSFYGW